MTYKPNKADDQKIKDMIDEGESLDDAVWIVAPDANTLEHKRLYNRIYRSISRQRKKESGEVHGKLNVDDEKVCAKIEAALDAGCTDTVYALEIATGTHERQVKRVLTTRAAMLDSESFEDFAENHYTSRMCSRDQARAVWCYLYPEDEGLQVIRDFCEGLAWFGPLPELDDEEREMCSGNMMHDSALRNNDGNMVMP